MLAEKIAVPGQDKQNEPEPESEVSPSDKDPTIGFESMAKTIGKKWKALSGEELQRCKDLAAEEMERYRREMDEYHLQLARKSRNQREEQLKRTEEMEQRLEEEIAEKDKSSKTGANEATAFPFDGGGSIDQLLRSRAQAQMMGGGINLDGLGFAGAQQLVSAQQLIGAQQLAGAQQVQGLQLQGLLQPNAFYNPLIPQQQLLIPQQPILQAGALQVPGAALAGGDPASQLALQQRLLMLQGSGVLANAGLGAASGMPGYGGENANAFGPYDTGPNDSDV